MDTTQPVQTAPQESAPKKVGPIIATLVIVLILIIAALYVFASRINQQTLPSEATSDATSTSTVKPVTNKSDDVKSMQADLNMSSSGLDGQGL